MRPANKTERMNEVILKKNQLGILEKDKTSAAAQTFDPDKYLTWLRREMHFKNTPLREVLDQVERWYNLKITLSDNSYASNRITILIENKPIEDILELISLVNNFEFEREGNQIIFSSTK